MKIIGNGDPDCTQKEAIISNHDLTVIPRGGHFQWTYTYSYDKNNDSMMYNYAIRKV